MSRSERDKGECQDRPSQRTAYEGFCDIMAPIDPDLFPTAVNPPPAEELFSQADIERAARALLDPLVDLTAEPPGPGREDYARSVAQRVLAAALSRKR